MWCQIFVRLFCLLSLPFFTLFTYVHCTSTTLSLSSSMSSATSHVHACIPYNIIIITLRFETCLHEEREGSLLVCLRACNIVSFFCTRREKDKGFTNNRETESSKNRISYALVLSSHLYLSFFSFICFSS